MEINQVKYNFKLKSIRDVKDLDAVLYEYEHLISKGKVAYLKNNDTNCAFAIGFRTIPEDSTGVCHIIEHSVLCGSKKYPLKEPFVNLLKNSLATFLNAFTAYDWTMYPFSSQTPKDFDNILSIYLDAVFNPLSIEDPKPFLQEGWHLELNNENDIPSYKGVVYNEMKGAMSDVDEVLVQATNEIMYKDTNYRFNSGGDPDVIPSLTYEAYKNFYKRHYTPQNAMTYFYGDLDIESKLKFLDEEYFSKYQPGEEININPQVPHINTSYEKEYEIGEDEEIADNTYMSLCYGLDKYENNEEFMAMQILCDALLSKNDSPIKKKLLDAKIGQNIVARIDDGNIIPALHIYLQKTNPSEKTRFKQIFEDEVKSLVKNGIDKKLLLASINFSEFKDKEMDLGRLPKGIIFAMNMMGSFNYRGDLITHLEFSKHYEKFKKELHNNYFENLLDKYILKSNHHVQVVVKPSKTLGKKKEKELNEKLVKMKEEMDSKEIKNLVKQTEDLLKYQNHVDTKEELDTLPKLELSDIPNSVNYLDSKKVKIGSYKGFTHELTTNKIGYVRMYFNVNKVSFDDLPYLILLKSLYLNCATKNYSSLDLTSLVKTYLGDLSFTLMTLSKSKDKCDMYLSVSSSALDENISYIPKIINEVILNTKYSKNEVKQNLQQIVNNLRQGIIGNGMNIATLMAKSNYSVDSLYASQALRGPKLYSILNNLLKNFKFKDVEKKLKQLSKQIFNKDNVIISLSGDKDTLVLLKENIKNVKLKNKKYPIVLEPKFEKNDSVGLIIPSQVSYNALGSSLELFDESFHGKYSVLSHIINYDYLWNEIRVKGGAYGCGLSVAKNNDISLGSYRDPNVSNTYEVYKKLPEYLKKFKPSKEEFKNYIIGAMSGFDTPSSTPVQIDNADINYLSNITKKDKIKTKKQVLKTKASDIRKMSKLFEQITSNCSKYTIGNENKIKECDFKVIKNL